MVMLVATGNDSLQVAALDRALTGTATLDSFQSAQLPAFLTLGGSDLSSQIIAEIQVTAKVANRIGPIRTVEYLSRIEVLTIGFDETIDVFSAAKNQPPGERKANRIRPNRIQPIPCEIGKVAEVVVEAAIVVTLE